MKKIIALIAVFCSVTSCSMNTLDQHMTRVGSMGDVSITDMRSQLRNKLLVAQVTFHNNDSDAVTGFYRCQFFDTNGMQLGQPQSWQPVTIYPNEDQSIKCQATQIEATNFKAEFSSDGKNVSVQKTT